jgi:hypothetical protein
MMARVSLLGFTLPLLLVLACGESSPPAKTADDAPETDEPARSQLAVSSEIGGLDEVKVNAAFESALSGLERCLNQGASRVEFLGGSVSFFVKIDTAGKADTAYVEKSTLGDRETEKCMLSELRAKKWPKPVGGEHGLARKSFDFDPPNDVRPPTDYDPDHLSKALGKISDKLASCKSNKGAYEATVYVATDGTLLAAGVTPPDETGEESVDCLVDALKSATFPSPGSWPAKVTFAL